MRLTGFENRKIEATLIFRLHPDFVTQIARVGDAVHHRRNIGDIEALVIHKFECGV